MSKVWDDKNNQDGKRPESIIVTLYENGVSTGKTLTLNQDNDWSDSFENLDAMKLGAPIGYTVVETPVEDYDSDRSGNAQDGYTITNSYKPETTEIKVEKVWDDKEDQDGKRPESIIVTLYANGVATEKTVILNADSKWTGSFTDLDVYKAGKKIVYTVKEGTMPEGYTGVTTGTAQDGFTITNTYETAKTEIKVEKKWNDENNRDNIRPGSITVALWADDVETDQKVVLNNANNWKSSFTDLDVYKNGVKICYTVVEVDVPTGYTDEIIGSQDEGYVVVNSHKPSNATPENDDVNVGFDPPQNPPYNPPYDPSNNLPLAPKTGNETAPEAVLAVGSMVMALYFFLQSRRRKEDEM